MTVKETIEAYFRALLRKGAWDACLAEDLSFTSFVSPAKHVSGRAAFLDATRGFYGMIASLEVRHVVVEGDRACVTTRYRLQPPSGSVFDSDVAEMFVVRDGRIASLEIYFDPTPYPRR